MENKALLQQWYFDPLIILLIAGITFLYYQVTAFKKFNSVLCFLCAIFLFILAECSPLNFLGMHYYFSAHMITHVTILLLCGPLLVLGLQPRAATHKGLYSLSSFLFRHSWVAWFTGVGIMWFWHIPVIFNAVFSSMQSAFSLVPVLHSGSMLAAGILFSWPLFSPFKNMRIQPLQGVVYLFTACISCSVLGLLITFAPLGTWHQYAAAGYGPWNLTPLADQQAAGLIMWVPCCFVYLSGCIYLLYRWFADTEDTENTARIQFNTNIFEHGAKKHE